MQRGLRVITLQGAIEKSPILLLQDWKKEWKNYFSHSNILLQFTHKWCFEIKENNIPFSQINTNKSTKFINHEIWYNFEPPTKKCLLSNL